MMTPEPTDKLDAATTVVVNGPADDPLEVEWIARRRPDRTDTGLLEPDASKGARPVLGGPGAAMRPAYPVKGHR